MQLSSHRHRVFTRLRFPDDVEPIGGVDDHVSGHPERGLVIDDEDTNGHRRNS